MKKLSNLSSRYLNWWLNDFPPLHGSLRFLVYTGLFYLAFSGHIDKAPLDGINRYTVNDPKLFVSYGLIKFLDIQYIAPEYMRIVMVVTTIAWFFAAIGLMTRFSMIVTALGVFFLHGMFLGSNALNHNWFLPMYAFIALSFSRTNDRWSVDYYLRKLWKKKNGVVSPKNVTIVDTGFARKLFLVFTAGFYFASGVTKVVTPDLAWHDGHTVHYFAQLRDSHPLLLTHLFANNLWLCHISSGISLILEVGAIATLLLRQARYIIVPGLVLMHLAIAYTLGPAYWTNIICLMLLINWGATIRTLKAWIGRALPKVQFEPFLPRCNQPAYPKQKISKLYQYPGAVPGVVGGTFLILLMLTVAGGQIFWWPLTNVYMYSSYFSTSLDIRANYPRIDYYKPETAQTIARNFLDSNPNIEATEYFAFLIALRLSGENEEPMYLYNRLGVRSWKQWVLTVARPVLIKDLAAKPLGNIEFDSQHQEYPAQQFLLDYASILPKYIPKEIWQKYQRVELVYPLIAQSASSQLKAEKTLPAEVWQKYQALELVNMPNLRLVPIASVLLKDINHGV